MSLLLLNRGLFNNLFYQFPSPSEPEEEFLPTNLDNLWGWWPADNINGQFSDFAGTSTAVTSDGDRVSAVTDKNTGTAGRRLYLKGQALTRRFTYKTNVQNGLPGWLAFEGDSTATVLTTDDELDTTNCSVIVACKTGTVSSGTTYPVCNAHNSTGGGLQLRVTGTPLNWAGRNTPTDGSATLSTTVESSTPYVIGYSAVSATPRRYILDNLLNSNSSTTAITSGNQIFRIGAGNNNNQNSNWIGHIFEVIVYSPAISDTDLQTVVNYLKTKWNI